MKKSTFKQFLCLVAAIAVIASAVPTPPQTFDTLPPPPSITTRDILPAQGNN